MVIACNWAFVEGATLADGEGGALSVQGPAGPVELRPPSPGLRAALLALDGDGVSEFELGSIVSASDGDAALTSLNIYLSRLTRMRLVRRVLSVDGQPLAMAVPTSSRCYFKSLDAQPERRYLVSRFAFTRRVEGQTVLESPLCHASVLLQGWQAAALNAEFARASTVEEVCNRLPECTEDLVAGYLELLLSVGLASATNAAGQSPEESNESLQQWEFHDLLFHTRSRQGRQPEPFGGTFRFKSTVPPLPALKAPMSADFVDLYRPDVDALKLHDVGFTNVVESRRSIPETMDGLPISASQLGEFLYRSARVTTQFTSDSGEYAYRIYPGGGAEYELELYLCVTSCDGLPPGIYHYAPGEHRLYKLSELSEAAYGLLGQAAAATMKQTLPQVLICYAARFQRVTWKYQSMAYALILKDVGALYQTMYLVATAMGLAPCALGGGDSDLFATVVNTDYYSETSVGEFVLGSRTPGPLGSGVRHGSVGSPG